MIRDDRQYTKDHEWIQIENGIGTVGITDFAQGELGEVVYLELPKAGTAVTAQQPFGTIEAVKAVAELFAPVSGSITEVNTRLADEAQLVNQDCYGDGWMIRIRLADAKEVGQLLSPEEYGRMIEGH